MSQKIYNEYGREIGTIETSSGCAGIPSLLVMFAVMFFCCLCCSDCTGMDLMSTPESDSEPATEATL